ncbi:hypothetical protein ACQKML_13735 [Peribacillus frigoritolerans]
MNQYNLRLHFDKDNGLNVKVESESEVNALYYVTGHKDWFYTSENVAIDMRKVTYVSILKRARISSTTI